MSRTKHYSIDDAEVLETKVDQLEKRLENIERFVFSQPKQDASSSQLVQVIAALIDKQNTESTVKSKSRNENDNSQSNENDGDVLQGKDPKAKGDDSENDRGRVDARTSKQGLVNQIAPHSHLNIDRLRTVI